jgi:hypothetical protein
MTSRPTRLLETAHLGATGMRVWEMRANADWPTPQIHRAARPLVERFAADVQGAAGFMIVHAARPALFVLAHIWDRVDLLQHCWTAPYEAPALLTAHRDAAIGCIWELEIIALERDRWANSLDRSDAVATYLGTDSDAPRL